MLRSLPLTADRRLFVACEAGEPPFGSCRFPPGLREAWCGSCGVECRSEDAEGGES